MWSSEVGFGHASVLAGGAVFRAPSSATTTHVAKLICSPLARTPPPARCPPPRRTVRAHAPPAARARVAEQCACARSSHAARRRHGQRLPPPERAGRSLCGRHGGAGALAARCLALVLLQALRDGTLELRQCVRRHNDGDPVCANHLRARCCQHSSTSPACGASSWLFNVYNPAAPVCHSTTSLCRRALMLVQHSTVKLNVDCPALRLAGCQVNTSTVTAKPTVPR